jgi:hypothetical protein
MKSLLVVTVAAVLSQAISEERDATQRPASRASARHMSVAVPVSKPRSVQRDLSGTYRTETIPTLDDGTRSATAVGLLVLSNNGEGLWHPRATSEGVLLAHGAVVTTSGRVGMQFGRIVTEGRLSESGFTLTGTDSAARVALDIAATRVDLPLAEVSGVYDVEVRTTSTMQGRQGEPLTWRGTLAVIQTRDSVWMDLFLKNQRGGSTGTLVRSPRGPGGTVHGIAETKSLRGHIRGGSLEMDWEDRRDNGNAIYTGVLRGQRR